MTAGTPTLETPVPGAKQPVSPEAAVIFRAAEEFARRRDQSKLIPLLGTSDGFYVARGVGPDAGGRVMRLVDTSCWTRTLRRSGDAAVREKFQVLLARNEAAWCNPIRLELWSGVANDWDEQILLTLDQSVPLLDVTDTVWDRAFRLAHRARQSGLNVPTNDVLIWACSQEYGVELEHVDRHYPLLAALK